MRTHKTKRAFDINASRYDQHAIVSQVMGDTLLERLDFIKIAPKTVLDLGAGTGYCLKPLMQRYPDAQITALDISPKMLEQAEKKVPPNSVEMVCGDLFEQPLKERTFDLIVANDVFTWVDSLAGFYERCLNWLNPGGLLLFSGLGIDTLKELRAAGQAVGIEQMVNSFYDIHDLGDALVHLGFSDPVLDMQHITVTYRSLDAFFNELKGAGSHLLESKHRTLMGKARWAALREAYKPSSDGTYPATFELVYGHAMRGDKIIRRHQPGEPVHIPLSELKKR